jgi:signal transduction histidine kinase
MEKSKKSKNTLKWSFDVNTFRLLGRDLITDRITALFELVKNSYDANAENVSIQFFKIGKRHDDSKIIIKDDGIGMSLNDIEKKWMVIGANNKRKSLYSPEPYQRRHIGEKGIGRFAVDKLGQYVRIRTRQKDDDKELVVTINWQTYEDLANQQTSLQLFTDIENKYEFIEPTFDEGTILEILLPRELWTLNDIQRTEKELSRLVSPFSEVKFPFNIAIYAPEYEPYFKPVVVETKEKDFASHSFKLEYDVTDDKQEHLFFDKNKEKLIPVKGEKQNFGFIKFYFYYFDELAKNKFNAYYKKTDTHIDGLKIYRDGILTTPFAEYEADDEKRRDVLGINKRRWRATFDRLGTRDCIGFIEITREKNPQIIDSTNRQDFLQTSEYQDLKEFIYHQLDTFMMGFKVERKEKKEENLGVFKQSQNVLKDIQKDFRKLEKTKENEKRSEVIENLSEKITVLSKGFKAINTEYKEVQKEEKRKEKMYFSLMSLSLFAANVSHAVRTVIYSIKEDAKYIYEEPTILENEKVFKIMAGRINREITRLLKVVDFMLKYAKTDLPDEEFNVRETIEEVFDAHESIFQQKKINLELDLDRNIFLVGNRVMFQDIITNLISNSIKALEGEFNRQVYCSASIFKNSMNILFVDNGIGIPAQKSEKIFDMYFTTTAEQGGAGIGLYIVKTNIEALGGNVRVIENDRFPQGATIFISLPFKK